MKVDFCTCLACRLEIIRDEARYRLDEGIRHTKFMLFRCKNCGKLMGFPQDNMIMFLEQGPQVDVEKFVSEITVFLQK